MALHLTSTGLTGGNFGAEFDDYEEGTYTVAASSSSGSFSSYTEEGRYTKLGRIVMARSEIKIIDRDGGGGSLWFSLPIAPDAISMFNDLHAFSYGRETNNTGYGLQAYWIAIEGRMSCKKMSDNANLSFTNNYTHVFYTNYESA